MQVEFETEDSRLQSSLDEVKSDIARSKERLSSLQKNQESAQASVDSETAALNSMENPETALAQLHDEQRSAAERHEELKDKFEREGYDHKIKATEADVGQHEREVERLTEIQQKIMGQIELRTQIQQHEKNIKQDSAIKTRLLDKCQAKLMQFFGQPVQPQVILKQYETRHAALEQELDECRHVHTNLRDKVMKQESAIEAKELQLEQARNTLSDKRAKIQQHCGQHTYGQAAAQAKDDVEAAEDSLRFGMTAGGIVDKAEASRGSHRQTINQDGTMSTDTGVKMKHGACPTCKREFSIQAEFDAFVAHWQEKLQKVKGVSVEELKRTKDNALDFYNRLAALEEDVTAVKDIESEEVNCVLFLTPCYVTHCYCHALLTIDTFFDFRTDPCH